MRIKALYDNSDFLNLLPLAIIQTSAQMAFSTTPTYYSFFSDKIHFRSFLDSERKLLAEAGASKSTCDYIESMLEEVREEVAQGKESPENIIRKIQVVIAEVEKITARKFEQDQVLYKSETYAKLLKKVLAVGIIAVDSAGVAGSFPFLGILGWVFAGSIAAGGVILKESS